MSIVTPIVIVGGGAGGLELAAKLGRKYGPSQIYLVDKDADHIWKPSLHEVAAGTLDIHREGLSYFMLARDCNFTFILGALEQLDKEKKEIQLAPAYNEAGQVLFPRRTIAYGTLVIAVGSKSNFFNTPGAAEHAITLDATQQAEHFRLKLLHALTQQQGDASTANQLEPLHIAIVGGGATGVELAAELTEAVASLHFYGANTLTPERHLAITLIEGAERILVALPEELSIRATQLLTSRNIKVCTGVRVTEVQENQLIDQHGTTYQADLCVWAAGIQAPSFLTTLGLETNRIHQLVVNERLETADPHIYAIGDCAQAPWWGEQGNLPARAQVAHQQASYLVKVLGAKMRGKPMTTPFQYKDYGSLVSVGHSKGVGSLMGVLSGKSWFVEGLVARIMYMSLHLMHHAAVLGVVRTFSLALGRLLLKRSAPRIKLH